uniref:Myb-like domain-containing protein n=1 Tax=Nothobranchius korthausae TaxID=1143690 RepID=A0A1A8H6R9_9TELE
MEITRGTESGSNRANDLPVRYLRLLAPPLQILSAAVWQVVQQGLVDHYGMLEEFVTMVTELVPELMSYSQRAQLILGLRARLVLELCRGEHPVDMQTIQPHLDRIKAPVSTAMDHHVTIHQVEESEVNFVELVHSLLEDPSERKYFFEEIFPVYFGPKYDTALEMLVWEFISRLDELLPVPDFTQLAAFLTDAPSVLHDCLQSVFPPDDMKGVLEHHRSLGHFEEKESRLLPMDDCILSSLSLPPGARSASDTASCSQTLKDSTHPDHKAAFLSAPSSNIVLENPSTKSFDSARQKLREERDPGSRHLQARGANLPQDWSVQNSTRSCDDTIDLTMSNEVADTDSEASNLSLSTSLRKRKRSGGVDVPAKQPVEASAFMDSSVDDENSSESPLISIWGDYTDTQERTFPVPMDSKVPWSDEETLHLLDIWGKDSMQRALKGCLKNRHIFTQIAQKMAERGYMRTVEQCQTRIKRLKKCFRQSHRGNSRQEHKFYSKLEQILIFSAPSTVPEVTYDVEEVADEEESKDGDEDLQFVGQTGQMEIGTRSVPWTDLETLALINVWGADKMQQDLRGVNRTGHLFSLISSQLASLGFSRTPEQCQTRLKRLKSNFRQCYQNNLKGHEQVKCKFYNELGRILVKGFESLIQMEEMSAKGEESDFLPPSHQEMELAAGAQEDRKKVPWSDKETVILLEIWGDTQVQQCLRRYPHNGHVFTEVSEKLNANGYSRTPDQCHTRIKRLKANYRQCKENMSLSGTDHVDFKFYDLLEQILEKQPSTSAAVVTDSIEISEDSNEESAAETETPVSTERPASSSWSDQETLALIEIWGQEEVQKSLRGFIHNGRVYAEIADRLHDRGFSKTPEQCRSKVKSLRINFRQCYDRKKCGRKVDYKFYHQLEQILGQEAVSVDEFDEREEQTEPDPGVTDSLNAPWTEEETVTLVEVWAADDVQHSLKTCVRNGHIFAEIAEKMATLGYLKTAEQCQCRIKRLKKTYRRYCNNRRNGGRPAVFRYFNLLAPVLGDDSGIADADVSAAEATLEPILDADPVLFEQPSTSHLLTDMSRKMPWSDQETRTLLEIWGEDNVQLTLRGCLKNRHVFEYISEKMSIHGFIRTTEQCYTRIKRLKYGFVHEKEEFKFFNEMDKIFRREVKVDESVAEALAAEESDDCAQEQDQMKSSQWVADSTKLAWGDTETETLLEIWGSEEIQESLKSSAKNKQIYKQVSRAMASQGYVRTPDQCQSRIKRLRANFRHFLEGRQGDKQECKFFDQLVQIFGDKYGMNSNSPPDEAPEATEF